MLACHFSVFADGLDEASLSEPKNSDSKSTYFRSRQKNFVLIKPLAFPKYNKDYKNTLLRLYERDRPKTLSNGLENLHWKKKYYSLLKRLVMYKDLKQYYDKMYKKPTKFNVVIIIYDLVPGSKDSLSYCKIFLNKKKLAETKKKLLSQKKKIKLNVKPDKRHLLFVEKYYLNKKKWQRVLNLYQPKPKYFRVPKNRIIVIEIIYDSSKEKPETAHLKYKYLSHYVKVNEDI